MNPERLNERLAEAAQYALLRRLAPAIRHDMAGMLQPISMMAAMLEKRIQKPAPDMAALGTNTAAISTMSREATSGCMSLMTWLAPKENNLVPLGEGLSDAISLVNTEMSFRGFNIVNETVAVTALLPRSLLRNAFMAGLMAVTDHAEGPADLLLRASIGDELVTLTLSLVVTSAEPLSGNMRAYRVLDWDDVNAIALAENARISHTASQFELSFPIAKAA